MSIRNFKRNFPNKIGRGTKNSGEEFLKYEIQEIEEAQLRPGEDESLETEYQKVSHAKEILFDCAAVHEVTAGQNGCAGDLIGSAVQRLYTVSNLDAEARGLTEQLRTIVLC